MNVYTRASLFVGFLLTVLLLPAVASAQQTITCESNNGHRKYCGDPNPGRVTLQRQISGASCVEGRSWGVDDRGLWVDQGCRAEFSIGRDSYGDEDSNGVTCESNDGRRKYCGRANPRRASLQRQLSNSPCVQGESWGVDDQGLWVDRGCRAVFSTGRRHSDRGHDYNDNDQDYGRGPDYPRVSADTSGRGSFNGRNLGSSNITRGWVDTRSDRPSVSLTGPRDFKITFYGDITRSDGRRIIMRITDSNRGRASGQAEIVLNGDQNEVESISITGNNINGNFTR